MLTDQSGGLGIQLSFCAALPCVLRLCADHLAGRSRKGDAMRALVARQFRLHSGETDLGKIESMKRNAIGGLANYLTMESLGKLEVAGDSGANRGLRDPRTAAAVRKSLGRDALPEAEVAEASSAAAQLSAAGAAASSSSSSGAASHARPDRSSIQEAEYTPVASPSVAALQAQLRNNKQMRLELERKAREGFNKPADADTR